jgi:hypothetical protein
MKTRSNREDLEWLTRRLRDRVVGGVVTRRDFVLLAAEASHVKTQRISVRAFDLSDSR